ncbi:MAG: beta-galactosidase [Bacteroidaceae bacterium]|nr:beta-galactosidase [Bacteroidaceae bacterium]
MTLRILISVIFSLSMSIMRGQLLREQFFTYNPETEQQTTRASISGGRLLTPWANRIDKENVLGEYPRPIMERSEWQNLNGYWDYAICDSDAVAPTEYDGKILVPFCLESYLSGVKQSLDSNQSLWYRRTFTVPEKWLGKRLILHFGAVDWRADVWVNNHHLTCHEGGYTSFSIDITDALCDSVQELVVRVWDPTDDGFQLRGKQVKEPRTIYYTSVTGIWQTVWIEPVNDIHFSRVVSTPDFDNGILRVFAATTGEADDCTVNVNVMYDDELVTSVSGTASDSIAIDFHDDFYTWTPENPNLYDLRIELMRGEDTLDVVQSYAAMRKYSFGKDRSGRKIMLLNNTPVFMYGPLDQGYWPDGLYTAPTDSALLFDIQKIKDCGFNMVRKHLKVEPARWYTYCDRIGLIVWQDIPSGDSAIAVDNHLPTKVPYNLRSEESAQDYMNELKDIIDQLNPYPCISTWVLFNEGVGQFNTKEIARWTKEYDPTRYVNAASGGNYHYAGDILDSHHYPSPFICVSSRNYVLAIGEFGGLGYAAAGHTWGNSFWSYQNYGSLSQLQKYYEIYTSYLYALKYQGLCAAVYTQLTDVESEINGIMTYDRKKMKMDEDVLFRINQFVINSSSEQIELAEMQ